LQGTLPINCKVDGVTILTWMSIEVYINPTIMNIHTRTLFVFLILSLATVPVFSQANKSNTNARAEETKAEPRTDGLKKIATRSARDWDFDIDIDEDALEATIEKAMEHAMKDVGVALEKLGKLEIHIDPIEINLGEIDMDMSPIKINLPELKVNIDPIDIDMDDVDIDIDLNDDHFQWNEEVKNKEKDEWKDKSENKNKSDKEKDKSKGLKKIN